MSSYSCPLRCNRCWRPLVEGFAWVTSCSHIFCEDDANKYFSRQESCPCCNAPIDQKADLKRIRPDSENSPAMVLWGQSPALILEACASALGFFMYQKKQELAWMNHNISQKDKQQQSIQAAAQQQIKEREEHISQLNEKISSMMEESQQKNAAFIELRKSHKDMTRICKNYEKLYNQMKAVKHLGRLKETPSPSNTKIVPITAPSPQNPAATCNFLENDRTRIDNHTSQVIADMMKPSNLPSSETHSIPEKRQNGKSDFNTKNFNTKTIPMLGKPPRQPSSFDEFTPKPLRIMEVFTKNKKRSNPLNRHSPYTKMKFAATPGARGLTTPMSIFQTLRPSLCSRFSIQRRN